MESMQVKTNFIIIKKNKYLSNVYFHENARKICEIEMSKIHLYVNKLQTLIV